MNSNLVTLDGRRGTGKSHLASGLRNVFGCAVLEVGPLFRLLAWLLASGRATDATAASEFLTGAILRGEIRVDMHQSGEMSACRIFVGQEQIEHDLWSSSLDPILSEVASTERSVQQVADFSRLLIKGGSTIVVGRETGSRMFPEALAKILLQSDESIRQRRKLNQLTNRQLEGITDSYEVEASEPDRPTLHQSYDLTIDTTGSSPDAVLQVATSFLVQQLSWVKK